MATSQNIDVDTCSSDNELVDAGNYRNETARFAFSQIHQYLQFGTYPSDSQKSDKQALRKRSKFFKSSDGNLYYIGRGKWHAIRLSRCTSIAASLMAIKLSFPALITVTFV